MVGDAHNAVNEAPKVLTQLPTPASPSGSTSSGFFEIVDQASTSDGESEVIDLNQLTASTGQITNLTGAVQTANSGPEGSAGQSETVTPEEKTVEELEEENEALEAEYRQRLKDKSNVLRLKLQAIARR